MEKTQKGLKNKIYTTDKRKKKRHEISNGVVAYMPLTFPLTNLNFSKILYNNDRPLSTT